MHINILLAVTALLVNELISHFLLLISGALKILPILINLFYPADQLPSFS